MPSAWCSGLVRLLDVGIQCFRFRILKDVLGSHSNQSLKHIATYSPKAMG